MATMSRRVAGLLWMCWSQVLLSVTAEAQNPLALEPGVALERRLAAGEAHLFAVRLTGGRHWRLTVDERGVNVVVEVLGPEDEVTAGVDNPYHRQGIETLVLTPVGGDTVRVRVRSRNRPMAPAAYQIRLDALDDATDGERRLLAAELATSRAGKLYFRDTADAWRQALAEYRAARELWRELGRRAEEARALHALAVLHRLLDDRSRALELAEETLTHWRALDEPFWQAASLNEIGINHWGSGRIEPAREAFDRALALVRSIGDRYEEAATRNSICLTFHARGDLDAARECYQLALPLFLEYGDEGDGATVHHNLGDVYRKLGEPKRSLDHFQQSLAIKQAAGDRRGEANTLNSIAVLYRELGELQEALDFFGRSLAVHRQLDDRRREASTLSNLGLVYYSLGEPRRALSLFEQALPMRRAVADPRGEAVTLNNLGMVHLRLGEPETALAYHLQALDLRRAASARRGEAITLDLIGRARLDLGDAAAAYQAFDQALALLRDVGDRGREAETLDQMGRLELGLGETGKALASLGRALELRRAVGDRAGEARTLTALALAQRASGSPQEARPLVAAALEIVESLRSRVISPHLRVSFLSSQREAYELEIDLLMERHAAEPGGGHDRAALAASERARARTLLDLLREAGADVGRGIDPELRRRLGELQRRLSAKAERQMAVLGQPHTDEQAAAAAAERFAALGELEALETEIRARHPRYAELTQPRALAAGEIQALLDPDTVLLEYALGEERSFLWLVNPGAVESFELPGRALLEDAAGAAYREISTVDLAAGGAEDTAAEALSRRLLGPVAGRLDGQRLVVVADGALHYIPFAALPLPAAGEPAAPLRRVLERHEVVHLPSASALAIHRRELGGRPRAVRGVAVLADPVFDRRDARVGDPPPPATAALDPVPSAVAAIERSLESEGLSGLERLPSTRREAAAIAALLPPDDVLVALDFDASRQTLLGERVAGHRIVHLATHGVIDGRHPELSGLVLSRVDRDGRPRNGFLRLRDVYNLELGAELVVLSGCQTALGRAVRGEGLVGLTRGFMYAGVPQVTASLWRVQDRATAELMAEFYRAMLEDGLAPPAALRKAQLSILGQRRWRDPYYWAAFVFQGDWK